MDPPTLPHTHTQHIILCAHTYLTEVQHHSCPVGSLGYTHTSCYFAHQTVPSYHTTVKDKEAHIHAAQEIRNWLPRFKLPNIQGQHNHCLRQVNVLLVCWKETAHCTRNRNTLTLPLQKELNMVLKTVRLSQTNKPIQLDNSHTTPEKFYSEESTHRQICYGMRLANVSGRRR